MLKSLGRARVLAALLLIALLAAAVAGCGGGSDSTGESSTSESTTNTSGSESGEEAEEGGEAATAQQEPEPSKIGISEPLPKAPPKGKSVVLVQCNLSICESWDPAMEASAEALGWTFKTATFTQGGDPGPTITQAIQEKPDYIVVMAVAEALIKPQLAEAHAADIPVIGCSIPEAASPKGYAAVCLQSLVEGTEKAAKWAIADSGEDAHFLVVNIPESPPLAQEDEWFEQELASACGSCSSELLELAFADLESGAIPNKVVAALQNNPEINYIYYGFTDIATGVGAALKGAGLSQVKQIGNNATEASIKGITTGEQTAWAGAGQPSLGALMLDAPARLSVGMKLTPKYLEEFGASPFYLVSSKEAAEALAPNYYWPGPTEFQKQFEELWQLH